MTTISSTIHTATVAITVVVIVGKIDVYGARRVLQRVAQQVPAVLHLTLVLLTTATAGIVVFAIGRKGLLRSRL